ncbi:MAG: tetratricopeptide repeat protein [Bacteroidota bacterium]|nr:tetratricopeptide repeat protein [Bacteroidota bacterium]
MQANTSMIRSEKELDKIDLLNQESWKLNRTDTKKAFSLAEEAYQLAQKNNYLKGSGQALRTMGACSIWTSKNDEALSLSFEAIKYLKQANEISEEAQVNYNIGTNFYYMADYDNSLKYFQQSYHLYEQSGNKLGMAEARNGMGTVYYTTGENQQAVDCLLHSLQSCRELNDYDIRQKVLDGLGAAYNNLKQYDKALEVQQECIELIRQHGGTPQVEAFVLDGMGNTYVRINEMEKALEHYSRSLEIRKRISFKVGEATTLCNIGKLYHLQNKNDKAFECLNEAYSIASDINSPEWIYRSSEALASLYEEIGNTKKALSFYKIFHNAYEEVRKEKAEKKSKSLEMQWKMEQVENEKVLLHKKNQELEAVFKDVVLLSEIGQKITSCLSAETIIETVYESLNTVMDASGFGIGLFDKTNNTLEFPGYIEKGEFLDDSDGYSLDDINRAAVWCYNNQKEVLIGDYKKEIIKYVKIVQEASAGELPESVIYIPLTLNEKKLGVITVQSFSKNAYTPYHLNIIKNLAVYTAIAMENARLYNMMEEEVIERTHEVIARKEEIEQAYENTRLLSEIGQQLTSTLSFEKIFNSLHENVNQLMDAACFGVRIYHPDKNMVEYKYELENGIREETAWVSMEDEDNYSVWCISNKKEIFLSDNQKEYQKYVKQIRVVSGDMPHSLIFYPMMMGDKVIGVITTQSFKRNAYSQYHLDILKTLASYTAIALENANLYENLEEKIRVRTLEVIQQKEIIEEKNKHITDSIHYAKRIQEAILPPPRLVKEYLHDSFIFFKPKDIVSGDFYWMERLKDKVIFAVVDCTGHGVPGALLSIVSHNYLTRSVNEEKLTSPAAILDYLNKAIHESLNKNKSDFQVNDGMDIAICALHDDGKTLEYAGAYNPLLLVKNNAIVEYKGNKYSIGSYLLQENESYTNHTINLEKGDAFYLFSDGYADQFGGTVGKKFKTGKLKELLLSIHTLKAEQQKQELDRNFELWKGGNEQVDDICIIGVKV